MSEKVNDIDRLLKRYYSGETSVDEEAELRRLLADGEQSERYAADRIMLLSMSAAEPELPAGFDESIKAALAQAVAKEHAVKRRRLLAWVSSAAVVALLIGVGVMFQPSRVGNPEGVITPITDNTPSRPQPASTEIKQAEIASAAVGNESMKVRTKTNRNAFKVSKPEILTSDDDAPAAPFPDDFPMPIESDLSAEEIIALEQAEHSICKMSLMLNMAKTSLCYAPE